MHGCHKYAFASRLDHELTECAYNIKDSLRSDYPLMSSRKCGLRGSPAVAVKLLSNEVCMNCIKAMEDRLRITSITEHIKAHLLNEYLCL